MSNRWRNSIIKSIYTDYIPILYSINIVINRFFCLLVHPLFYCSLSHNTYTITFNFENC